MKYLPERKELNGITLLYLEELRSKVRYRTVAVSASESLPSHSSNPVYPVLRMCKGWKSKVLFVTNDHLHNSRMNFVYRFGDVEYSSIRLRSLENWKHCEAKSHVGSMLRYRYST